MKNELWEWKLWQHWINDVRVLTQHVSFSGQCGKDDVSRLKPLFLSHLRPLSTWTRCQSVTVRGRQGHVSKGSARTWLSLQFDKAPSRSYCIDRTMRTGVQNDRFQGVCPSSSNLPWGFVFGSEWQTALVLIRKNIFLRGWYTLWRSRLGSNETSDTETV